MNQRAAAEEREEAEIGAASECGYSEDGSQLPSVSTSGDVGEGARKGKGRCKYAPEERERIRRERNRIHAKRTRDRRKKFMMDSEKVMGRLMKQNDELRQMLDRIYGPRSPIAGGVAGLPPAPASTVAALPSSSVGGSRTLGGRLADMGIQARHAPATSSSLSPPSSPALQMMPKRELDEVRLQFPPPLPRAATGLGLGMGGDVGAPHRVSGGGVPFLQQRFPFRAGNESALSTLLAMADGERMPTGAKHAAETAHAGLDAAGPSAPQRVRL